MSTIQSRLEMLLSKHKLTASQLADNIGVQRSSLSHILAGRNKPSLDFVERLLKFYPDVDAGWLITGNRKAVQSVEQDVEEIKPASKKKKVDSKAEIKQESSTEKSIVKVLTLYSDGTFTEFLKNSD